jgi:hypothetical protein
VETVLESMKIRLVYMDRLERERNLSILRGHSDQAALNLAWERGTLMSIEQAIEFALQESS